MFHIVLYEPEIPPNTGNIIRLCANTGTCLHLIRPLGFNLEDKQLKRAGLDYHESAAIHEYDSYDDLLDRLQPSRILAVSTRGKTVYTDVVYREGDVFLFGPETRGLPVVVLETFPDTRVIRIPMLHNSRSLNLSNAAAVVLYEAWRQHNFASGPI
jgi:tRNA (cytidine/uridine-2'-O-)-methyltransferase